MHWPLALVLCLSSTTITVAQRNSTLDGADTILGVWLTADGEGHIEITRDGEKYEGTIVGGADGRPRLDEKNPDPSLRDRPLLGLTILSGFVYDGNHEWKNGRIYDPNNGKTYKCKLRLRDDGSLDVRGYVGISLFGRTETFTRLTAAGDSAGPSR